MEVSIITPYGVVEAGNCDLVVVKTEDGELGVMANHSPLVAKLAIGEARIMKNNEVLDWVAISGGFLEVHENKVIILAKSAEKAEDIDVARAKEAKQRAEKLLAGVLKEDADLMKAQIALQRALNRIKIGGSMGKRL